MKPATAANARPYLFTTTRQWLSARFVGLGANHAAKEWRTRAGAARAAARFGGDVFPIVGGVMQYDRQVAGAAS